MHAASGDIWAAADRSQSAAMSPTGCTHLLAFCDSHGGPAAFVPMQRSLQAIWHAGVSTERLIIATVTAIDSCRACCPVTFAPISSSSLCSSSSAACSAVWPPARAVFALSCWLTTLLPGQDAEAGLKPLKNLHACVKCAALSDGRCGLAAQHLAAAGHGNLHSGQPRSLRPPQGHAV